MLFRRAVFGNVAPCGILKHCSKCCADNTRFYVQTGTGRRGRRPLHISKSGAKVFYTTMYGVRCPSRRVTEHRSPAGFPTLYRKIRKCRGAAQFAKIRTKKANAHPRCVRQASVIYLQKFSMYLSIHCATISVACSRSLTSSTTVSLCSSALYTEKK